MDSVVECGLLNEGPSLQVLEQVGATKAAEHTHGRPFELSVANILALG